MLLGEVLVEGLEDGEHLAQQRRLRQDGGAEVEGAGALPEAAAGHHADTCPTYVHTLVVFIH